ncbi:hypothetical protein Taro_009558 [Colocasia esculenta]|uniref:Receptor-like serine/threonine-protein kinase n=1 Tax=Colocasia esculenta TaxID=4460 RepID=A0A843U535_COLES|nr:hypothetical protein [Colocasia esculenta]
MGLFFLFSVFLVVLSSSHRLLFCAASDRLAAGQVISINQTIVSAGQIFALGLFSPENSDATNLLYAGIWYNRLPGRTIVWVANRERPLRDPAGVLTVTEDGNIAVLDGMGRTIWSTELTGVPSTTSAVLLDSGNLVLRHGNSNDVWQTSDHPADTWLPGMKLRSNLSTGAATRLTSWRGAADPSPGLFVFTADPKTSLQFYIFNRSEILGRQRPWDGKPAEIFQQPENPIFLMVARTVKREDEISWSFEMVDDSMLGRLVLDHNGMVAFFIWVENLKKWTPMGPFPTRTCDFYNRCGSFAACVLTQSSCRCLDGFEPKSSEEWMMGNFRGGCVRRLQLQCDGTDRFVKVPGMKLPDGFSIIWNKSMQQCEAECSARCRCQGYAFANLSILEGRLSGSRCLIWVGEMKDLVQIPVYAEDLYVRLHAYELAAGDNRGLEYGVFPGKNRGRIKTIMPILSFVILLLTGICRYFFTKRHKSRVDRRTGKVVPPQGLDISNAFGSEKEMPDVALLDFKVVKAATSNFCSETKLGEGGFGSVHKGRFLNGQEVAVKRLSKGSKQDPTRSMELNWEKRFSIIKGIANGLLYLHQHSRMRVIHRDLKTSNILLDSEMNPKISDFGLARTFQTNQDKREYSESSWNIVSFLFYSIYFVPIVCSGYMSPEYALNGVFSEKSDVFGFGVILLEIITGKKSTGFYPDNNYQSLFGYAWQMWEGGRALELLDPSMLSSSSSSPEILRCTQLAMLCIQEDAADRPTMSSIVFSLSSDTCTLSVPKKPAFVFGRGPNRIMSSSQDNASKGSINEVTGTSIEGR